MLKKFNWSNFILRWTLKHKSVLKCHYNEFYYNKVLYLLCSCGSVRKDVVFVLEWCKYLGSTPKKLCQKVVQTHHSVMLFNCTFNIPHLKMHLFHIQFTHAVLLLIYHWHCLHLCLWSLVLTSCFKLFWSFWAFDLRYRLAFFVHIWINYT